MLKLVEGDEALHGVVHEMLGALEPRGDKTTANSTRHSTIQVQSVPCNSPGTKRRRSASRGSFTINVRADIFSKVEGILRFS